MRVALAFSALLAVALAAPAGRAASRVIQLDPVDNAVPSPSAAPAGFESYHGYIFDLSQNADRKDQTALAANLKRQLDIVDNAGLSPRVLNFFHSIPIVAAETECLDVGASAACYGLIVPNRATHGTYNLTAWDHDRQQWVNPDVVELAVDSGLGVIMLRPNLMTYAQEPVMLHELLHAYHARMMPNGFANLGIKGFYAYAKSKNQLPKDTYALKNQMEFFAVTASIFLVGKDSVHEPFTRASLKEKMPDYYKYLVGLFGFDPDNPNGMPLAETEAPQTQAQ